MKRLRIHTVEMVRKIRDRQVRRLAGKTPEQIVAFYRTAGEAAMRDAQQRARTRRRKAG
ncbi:MAG TPA: hypothetical protein VIX35_07675 [Vicinamibacterales bacterium]